MTLPIAAAAPGVAEALRQSELFSGLAEPILRELAARSTSRSVRRGERLWNHGTPATALAIVAQGRVKCWSPGDDSRQWVSAVVRNGGACGLAATVDGGAYSCNAEPMERSRILLVPQSALRTAMERDAGFARKVCGVLASEVRRALTNCEDVTLRTPLQRLARYLAGQPATAGVIELRETQTQIAAQLGTVREVVGRGLRLLEAKGIVARTGRLVRILRQPELAEIAHSV